MAQEFKLLGIEELDAQLKEFQEKTSKRIINLGLKKASQNACDIARDFAPIKSGQTQQALKIERIKRNKKYFGWKVQIGMGDYRGDQFYASFVEMGHHLSKASDLEKQAIARKKVSPGWRRQWLEGTGWLRKAFDLAAPSSMEIAITTIKQGIERELR
jgi:hypothetical protein